MGCIPRSRPQHLGGEAAESISWSASPWWPVVDQLSQPGRPSMLRPANNTDSSYAPDWHTARCWRCASSLGTVWSSTRTACHAFDSRSPARRKGPRPRPSPTRTAGAQGRESAVKSASTNLDYSPPPQKLNTTRLPDRSMKPYPKHTPSRHARRPGYRLINLLITTPGKKRSENHLLPGAC